MIMMWPGLVWCFLSLGTGMILEMADMGQGDRGQAEQAHEIQTWQKRENGVLNEKISWTIATVLKKALGSFLKHRIMSPVVIRELSVEVQLLSTNNQYPITTNNHQ